MGNVIKFRRFKWRLVRIGLLCCVSYWAVAQEANKPTQPESKATEGAHRTSLDSDSTDPLSRLTPAELSKKARKAGYSTQNSKGVTQYCREEATVGTRFTTKSCVDKEGLLSIIQKQAAVRDALRRPTACTGGGSCNGQP